MDDAKIKAAVAARKAYDANHGMAGAWLAAEDKLTASEYVEYMRRYRANI